MLTYDLSARVGEKKYLALYRHIKEDILSGVLRPDERLPSKRALASHLGISVITVENAYHLLVDEGYAYAKERSGCYVRPIEGLYPRTAPETAPLTLLPEEPSGTADALFPHALWARTVRTVMSRYGERLYERSPNKGCARLRNAVARYLLRYRGMFAAPERIIIGSGSEQLYGSVVRMLGRDRVYGIEEPSYTQIRAVYEGTGAQVEPLPMGADGIRSEALAATGATVLHVTPFHSYPSGVTAPAPKRYEYLEWAQKPGRYLVEDDFDSEFFMPGKPLETLYSMDKTGRVIYINTFSKSLSPSMRLGYMILPEALLSEYDRVLGQFSCSVPLLEQYTLAEFLENGDFERHLSRKRRRLRGE